MPPDPTSFYIHTNVATQVPSVIGLNDSRRTWLPVTDA